MPDQIKVTFTDTFGGELNYRWAKSYTFPDHIGFKSALTKAKNQFFSNHRVPRHQTLWGDKDITCNHWAVKFANMRIAATIEIINQIGTNP
jgi:hypothetical protein